MLISTCIFGYGEAAKDFVAKFRDLPGYGEEFRIHMIQVKSLQDFPEVALNSIGQWKLRDSAFENEEQGISFGDDLVWLRESGWQGHDVIIDCSDEGDYFAEEIEYQMSTSPRMKLYQCTKLEEVDALIQELKDELVTRREQKARWEASQNSEAT